MGYTLINLSDQDAATRSSHWKLGVLGILVVLVLCFLHWGGYLLFANDPVPAHVDAAVVAHGSVASQTARLSAAMAMLQRGSVDQVVLGIPKQSYWEEDVAQLARQYLTKTYGAALASRVDFCDTQETVTSTAQEAQALSTCIQEHRWKAIVLVTSNYNGRLSDVTWRKILGKSDPSVQLWVNGISDSDYQPRGWWRQPLYARIWVTEFTSLIREIL